MIDSVKKAEYEQAELFLIEYMPRLWWNMYEGLHKQGFTKPEAMDIVKTYILSQGSGG